MLMCFVLVFIWLEIHEIDVLFVEIFAERVYRQQKTNYEITIEPIFRFIEKLRWNDIDLPAVTYVLRRVSSSCQAQSVCMLIEANKSGHDALVKAEKEWTNENK